MRPSIRVDQHRDAIRAVVAEHHTSAPRVFGSIARCGDRPGSDVNLLVNFNDEALLLDEIGLRLALVGTDHVDVDVVSADALRGPMGERILGEAVAV